jgi:hypothetical protein
MTSNQLRECCNIRPKAKKLLTPKEHVKELEKTFFDEIDEDSEKCLPQTKSSEQLS